MGQLLMHKEKPVATGMKVFILIWLGSFVSILGDGLTDFALDIWILQTTESLNFYTLGILCITLPALFLAPLSGALVDRWPRRWVMIISEIGSAFCILAVALLFMTHSLKIWYIYPFIALSATFMQLKNIAFKSTISLLVPSEDLARASGLTRVVDATSQLAAPVLAAVLLGLIQIQGILLIDCLSFVIAVIPLLRVRIPEVEASTPEVEPGKNSFISEITQGWTYLSKHAGLVGLIALQMVYTFISTVGTILFVPMILNLTTANTLSFILCIASLGGILGGILMSTWANRRKQLVPVICGCMLGSGLEAIISGLRPSLILITIGAFFFLLTVPLLTGSIQVIFQKQIAPELQGRIFSLSNVATSIAILVAISSTLIVDRLFEPLMFFEGPWAKGIGQIIGTGPGRGIGLMYIILGGMAILSATIAYRYPPLLEVEQ
ncbi:MAG: MFS transporter [Symploca sp. SIO2C1]|nr:MFS transporter [Symploca sp. SIO2C1]